MPTTEKQITEIIPLSEPEICGNEWVYVKDCLDQGWVSSAGDYVDRFEQEMARIMGKRYTVATGCGTAALHVALLIAGVQPEDEVLVSGLSFIAPANAIRYCGAHPVFIGAEAKYWQIDPERIRDFAEKECIYRDGILKNKTTGRRISALLPVDILGHPVDMDAIMETARKFEFQVVEDAAESLGARYKGHPVGRDCPIVCISFNGNKIITSGAGGAILTDDAEFAGHAKYLTTQSKRSGSEYIHDEIGYNYRMSNIHAAIGCAQLENLHSFLEKKRNIAQKYTDGLKDIKGINLPGESEDVLSTFWLYTILLDKAKYGLARDDLIRYLDDSGIKSRPLWQPLYRNKPYRHSQTYHTQVIDDIYEQAVSLPSSAGLTAAQQQRVIQAVIQAPFKVYHHNSRN